MRNVSVLVYAILLVALLFLVFGGPLMVSDNQAVRAMESAGYTDVKVTTRVNYFVTFYGCAEGDSAYFEMRGKNSKGDLITNAFVCVGWPFKGATIRYR